MKRILLLFITIFLFSCETDITDTFIINQEKKLVLVGELIDGASPSFNLTRTVNMLEEDTILVVDDALLELVFENDTLVMRNTGEGNYVIDDFIVEAGQRYFILGSREGFDDISVDIKVPEIPEYELNYTVTENYVLECNNIIMDSPDFGDNYSICVSGWKRRISHDYENDVEIIDTSNIYDTFHMNFWDSVPEYRESYNHFETVNDGEYDNYSRGKAYFSDRQFNGQNYEFYLGFGLKYIYNDTIPVITMTVEKLDSNMINFISSYVSYYSSLYGNDFIDSEFPLTQPVHLYSNVNGGFGYVFAKSSVSVDIDVSEWYNDPDFLDQLNGEE